MHRPLLCPRVIYPGRKSELAFALWREKNMNKSDSCLCLHKHQTDSGRSNWWPARKRRRAEQGEATQPWDSGFTLAVERRLYCQIRAHANKTSRERKTRLSGSTSAPSSWGASSYFFKNHKGEFCKMDLWKDLTKMWEYFKIQGDIKSVGHVKKFHVFTI